jgi:hypothetical protein
MRRVDLFFLLLGSVMLLAGVVLGVVMGATHDFQLSPVHAHVNLVGWASLALFGLTYRAYPAMGHSRLAKVHLALAAPSAILFPIGIYMAAIYDRPGLAIGASLFWLAGCGVFVAQIIGQLRAGEAAGETLPTAAVPAE